MVLQKKFKNKIFNILKTRKKGLEFLFYNILGNMFTFLLHFILPFFLANKEYGYFALVFSIFNLGAVFFTFGLDTTIIKFSIEKKECKNILLSSLSSWFLLAGFSLIFFIVFSYYITKNNILEMSFCPLVLVILASFFISAQRIVLSFYIGIAKIKKYGILFCVNKLIQFSIILIAAILLENNIFLKCIPYLILVQSVIVSVMIFSMEKNQLVGEKNVKKDVVKVCKFTLPLSLNVLGSFGYSYGFNVFLSPFLTLSQLGVLNIYTQLSNISLMTINALNNGYIRYFYKKFSVHSKKAIIEYFKYIAQNAFFVSLFVFLFGSTYKFLYFKSVEDYDISSLSYYFLCIFLYSFKSIGSNILIIKGKNLTTSVITIMTSGINIAMAVLLTKYFSFWGCILGLSAGYLLQVIVFNLISLKLLTIRVNYECITS
jgi:O-antigen/teichoic acid export membrane protein